LPSRADLGRWINHAIADKIAIEGASDHLVSEALYLTDPEGNGIEIYSDRLPKDWKWNGDKIAMATERLNLAALAASVPDCAGVYLVPAFAGLGAPHWDQYARGNINGLTRGTTAAHIARAALEGIAFQVADVLEVMKEDSGIALDELRVDGGASANNLLMQIQADILGVRVVRPKVVETTALGAAYLAGLATGFWKNRAEVQKAWEKDREFEPQKAPDEVAYRRNRWAEALQRARQWEHK